MSACVIGIDVGTSGVRAAALDELGAPVSSAAVAMTDFGDPAAPHTWWRCVRAALTDLGAACDLSQVRGLAVDGTSGTMLAVDRLGEPVGSPRMYDEPCGDEAAMRAIAGHAPADSAARGATSGLARVLLMQDRPGALRLLHQADWIAGRLSGRFGYSDWNNALKTGYDPVATRWPAWIKRAGADVAKLPLVLEPGAPIARVSPEAVGLGLPASAIVHAGTTDGCASFLATGAAEAGEGVTALGSTLVVKLLSDRPLFAPKFGVYSHRIGSAWLAGGASNTGGKVIEHFFARQRLAALSAGLRPEVPTGLNYYPLLRPGERFPVDDPALAPRLEPRPEDDTMFFQAILEGIAAIEALAYGKLAELGAPAPRSIRTVGGGAGNAAWTKIRKGKLGVPFEQAESQHACVGVARLVLRRLKDRS
ncbi:MAG TPA: FGGY-family carbohydrate kinase [Roseiarcus sp.]|nr:FGGY-family carbohydrate kinase [Roseiarcus sp.]